MKWSAILVTVLLIVTACDSGRPQTNTAEPEKRTTSNCESEPIATRMRRGYVPRRSPDVLLVPHEPNYLGTATRPVHTGPWDYLVQVPLMFYGPGAVEAEGPVESPATLADVAPTVGALAGADPSHDWDGHVLDEVLTGKRPRLVVVVVLDGVGRNVLAEHPGTHPFLERIQREGIDYAQANVGSSPSNTPPIHTTIGTGVFPRRHGVPHVQIREGEEFVDPFEGNNGEAIRVPTLADIYDAGSKNAARIGLAATVNWHLGMIGHGAAYPGGDRDEVLLLNDQGRAYGDDALYELSDVADPTELERLTDELDAEDGERDGLWRKEDLSDPAVRYMSPAFVRYEQLMLERMLQGGYGDDPVTDLVFVNMKAADTTGHAFGMTSEQVGELVRAEDAALRRTARHLDSDVGRGNWVLVVTADHGQTPYPDESGAWAIRGSELKADLQREFGEASVQRVTSAGVFLSDRDRARDVAEWIGDYTVSDNIVEGEEAPSAWADRTDEPLFDMVLAGRRIVTDRCA